MELFQQATKGDCIRTFPLTIVALAYIVGEVFSRKSRQTLLDP